MTVTLKAKAAERMRKVDDHENPLAQSKYKKKTYSMPTTMLRSWAITDDKKFLEKLYERKKRI